MLKRLIPYFKGYGRYALFAPLLVMLETVCELLIPLQMARIVDVGIETMDLSVILSSAAVMLVLALIAMLLIGTCFIAVGIFVSTLTESAVTASIGTMGILVGFAGAAIFNNLIDTYIIRYVLSWISIYSRYVNFTYGIFDIAATLYYLSITAIFLFLAVRVYERRRYA